MVSFSSNQLSLVVPVTRKVNAQSHSLILVHKSDAVIACERSQLGDNLEAQASGLVRLFACKSNFLMAWYLLLAFFQFLLCFIQLNDEMLVVVRPLCN